MTVVDVDLRLLGIRHHGPGSARAVLDALESLRPRMVLVEAPADTTDALAWIGTAGLEPPVALLGHARSMPARAVFAPFAIFSPEWCAVSWANHHDVEVRAIDLPWAVSMALPASAADDAERPRDPVAELAAAAGDPDPERWWEDVVEHRRSGPAALEAVGEAMAEVRREEPTGPSDQLREAYMRRAIRTAIRDVTRAAEQARSSGSLAPDLDPTPVVAVVCGAWHVPALDPALTTVSDDAARLRGLPRTTVDTSWVPWTHRRLAAPDYGARVAHPGWYHHVFEHPGPDGVARFLVDAARLLRGAGIDTSPDHLVAATRAAEVLAVMRGRPRPGLVEALDSLEAVTGGLPIVLERLVLGDAVGRVPPEAPQAPLLRDVAAERRRLRLRPTAGVQVLELDLRTPTGLGRSRLLHRLDALGVGWGVSEEGRSSTGTFRETWRLHEDPETAIRLVERSAYGVTVAAAASAYLADRARAATDPADLARMVDLALLADLPDAVGPLVSELASRAASAPDLGRVIDALAPLARAQRYGDVRGTQAAAVAVVFDGLVVRVLAGLSAAARSLDDDAAVTFVDRLSAVAAALALADHPARGTDLDRVLRALADPPVDGRVHGAVQGRAARLRYDRRSATPAETVRRLGRALTPGTPVPAGARFLDGFLGGGGTVLVHDRGLLEVIDAWLCGLEPEAFAEVVPLLRRTFGTFGTVERRRLGALLAGPVPDRDQGSPVDTELDPARVALALETVRHLLGLVVHPSAVEP